MGQKSDYGVSGLNTAPSPIVGVPPGALSVADNCVIRRTGMIEPRPGFYADATLTLDEIWKMIPYNNAYLAVGEKTGAQKSRWSSDLLTDAVFDKHYARGVEARKNLYLTTSDAVRVFAANGDTTAAVAGRPQPVLAMPDSTTPGVIGVGLTVVYRATISRTDANNVTTVSEPSARMLYGAVAASQQPSIQILWNPNQDVIAGDVIKLYRTDDVSTGTPPPDELFLAYLYTLTAADISSGYTVIVDARLEADLGEALYTNATQEGIRRANTRPPRARDLALFAGSMFAADIKYPHEVEFEWAEGGNLAGSAAGIGVRAAVGTITNGSATMTLSAAGDSVGWQVGMLISTNKGDHWSPQIPRVTSVSGATIGLSSTWGGSTDASAVVVAWDTIKIVGSATEYYPTANAAYLLQTLAGYNASLVSTVPIYGLAASVQVVGSAEGDEVSFYDDQIIISGNVRRVQLQRLLPNDAAFTIAATHGNEFSPAIPLISSGSSLSSTQDAFPNGLTWSKQEEPEHFMRGQLWLVGSARSLILRIIPLRDALYIFKGNGDGIYRLTGFGERSGWNVQQLDPTTSLLHPELVTVLEDMIYAWTNTGMCKIDASGQEMLNGPIMDLTDAQEFTLDSSLSTHAYAFAAANLQDHEVIFGLPASDNDGERPADTWVYNTRTNAWTTWFGDASSPYTMAFDPSNRRLLRADTVVRRSRYSNATVFNADLTHAITVSGVTGLNVTIAGGSGWSPVVGDLVVVGVVTTVVIDVTDTTHFTVQQAVGVAAGSAYEGFDATIAWLPKVDPTGAVVKRYQSLITHWDDIYGLYTWTQTVSGPRTNNQALIYTKQFDQRHLRAETRALLSAQVSMDTQLYPGLAIRTGDARWRITGMSENYEIATERVSL